MAGFWSTIKNFIGLEPVVNTAMKVVEKVTGTDDSPAEKRKFFLEYIALTKHQSPMRRFIAFTFVMLWVFVTLLWLGHLLYGLHTGYEPAKLVELSLRNYLEEQLKEPVNYIIMFYFGVAVIQGLRGEKK